MQHKVYPNCHRLSKYIEYYWIIRDIQGLFSDSKFISSYAGITPELVFPIQGSIAIMHPQYSLRMHQAFISTVMYDQILLDFTELQSAVVVRFKSNAVASLLPFVRLKSEMLTKAPLILANKLFGPSIDKLGMAWKTMPNLSIGAQLDQYFTDLMEEDRVGFILDLYSERDDFYTVGALESRLAYSTSTIERHFKKETGLTPKKYMMMKRFRSCLHEILENDHRNWMEYVVKYQYHDQSHFIKEMKRFTGLSPQSIMLDDSLPKYRPDIAVN